MIKVTLYGSSADEVGKLIEDCPLKISKTKIKCVRGLWIASLEGRK